MIFPILKNRKSYIKYGENIVMLNIHMLMYFNIWNEQINFY